MRTHWRHVALAMAVLILVPAVAVAADPVDPDANVDAVGNQNPVNLGTVAPGATIARQVSFSLRCAGGQHVDAGQTITLTWNEEGSTVLGGTLTATDTAIGPIPSSWPDDVAEGAPSNCGSPLPAPIPDRGNSVVTMTAPAIPGSYLYNIRWDMTLTPAGSGDDRAIRDHTSAEFTLRVEGESVPPSVRCAPPAIAWSPVNVEVPCTASDASGLADAGDAAFILRSSVPGGIEDPDARTDGRSVCDIYANCTQAGPYAFAVDRRAPMGVTAAPDRAPDGGTWYRDPVIVTWSGSDGGSGIDSCSAATYDGPDGTSATVVGRCTDVVGNQSDPVPFSLDFDGTKPDIVVALVPGAAPSGWWNAVTGAPTARFSCSDATSGMDECASDQPLGEGAGQSVRGQARDRAGNTRNARADGIDVDLTDPGLVWVGGPGDGASYPLGSVPPAPTCVASDGLSGPAGCAVSGHGTGTGTWELVATAHDAAGNRTRERRTYTVLGYRIEGFGTPVRSSAVGASASASIDPMDVAGGRALPLRFRVIDASGAVLADPAIVIGLTVQPVDCETGDPTGPTEPMTTVGGGLRVHDGTGRFQVEWKVPRADGCVRASVHTGDGSVLSVDVRIR